MDLSEIPENNYSRHPWELARARFFLRLLQGGGLLSEAARVLDVGSGDAYFARRLHADKKSPSISLTCWDHAYLPQDLLANDDPSFIKTHQQPEQIFDLVLMMDVLEHVDEDIEFLRQVVEHNMGPNSTLLISVPAWQHLYSKHDKKLFHRRRYAPRALRPILSTAGLRVRRSGGLFHSLLPVRVVQKSAELITDSLPLPKADKAANDAHGLGVWQYGPLLTRSIQLGLGLDNWFFKQLGPLGAQVPGLSWWALCTKQAS